MESVSSAVMRTYISLKMKLQSNARDLILVSPVQPLPQLYYKQVRSPRTLLLCTYSFTLTTSSTTMIYAAASATASTVVSDSSSSSSLGSQLVEICAKLAPLSSILLCLAPLPTIQTVKNAKSVGKLPLLPYTCLFANVMLWGTYGLLTHEMAVVVPNVIGLILAVYYVTIFIQYAPRTASPTLPGSAKQHVAVMTTIAVATATAARFRLVSTDAIGKAAVVLCIAMFASPLIAVKTVIETKSAASIPLPFTICSLLNTSTWLVTGVYKLKDWNIAMPNVLGLLFGFLQVTLKLIYGGDDDEYKSVDTTTRKTRFQRRKVSVPTP